jgi:hypothetical protein
MNRKICALVSSLVVTGCAFAGFYWCSRPLLQLFGVSEYAQGIGLAPFLLICVGSVLIGTVVGLFLFPVVLRPFLSSANFWGWIDAERGVTIPLLDPLLKRWAVLLYGKRIHANHPRSGA